MHLHVKIVYEYWEHGICEVCLKEPLFCMRMNVFAGSGTETLPWKCGSCLVQSEGEDLHIEQADMSPGRLPPNKRDKKQSRKQELRIAEDIGGRRQPGSGNQDHAKGDVRKKGVFRGEAKYTRAKTFTLRRYDLNKITSECVGAEKPFFQIDFCNRVTNRVEDSWVVIPYEDWKEQNEASQHQRPAAVKGNAE